MRRFDFRDAIACPLLILAIPLTLPAQDSQKPSAAAATVAGQPIYEQDLMTVAGPGLLDLHKQEYKLKTDALNQAIRKKLVELEAKKRGLTLERAFRESAGCGLDLISVQGGQLPVDHLIKIRHGLSSAQELAVYEEGRRGIDSSLGTRLEILLHQLHVFAGLQAGRERIFIHPQSAGSFDQGWVIELGLVGVLGVMHFPVFALGERTTRGFRSLFCMWMDRREGEIPVCEFYFAFVFCKHIFEQGLHSAAERTLKVGEFYDGNRRVGVPLYPLRVVIHLDQRRL